MSGSRALVATALLAHLREVADGRVSVYDGEVPSDPPKVPNDATGRVAGYVVLYTGAGTPRVGDDAVAGTSDDLRTPFQLTCAAGYPATLRWVVDLVHPHVHLWRPPVAGAGRFRVPEGYDPGTARRDEAVRPPRHWLPLQYQLDTTR